MKDTLEHYLASQALHTAQQELQTVPNTMLQTHIYIKLENIQELNLVPTLKCRA